MIIDIGLLLVVVVVEDDNTNEDINENNNTSEDNIEDDDTSEDNSISSSVQNDLNACIDVIVKIIEKIFGSSVVVDDENAMRKGVKRDKLGGSDFGFSVSFRPLDISGMVNIVGNVMETFQNCTCGNLSKDIIMKKSTLKIIRNRVLKRMRRLQ